MDREPGLGSDASGGGKYAPRGGLNRDELVELVEAGATLREIADATDRSVSTVRYWLGKYGLQTRNCRGLRRRVSLQRVDEALRRGERTLAAECATHGWTTFVIETSGRTRCRRCRMERVSEWRRRTKRRLVHEAGGACAICGYDKCMAALEFHHLDPSQKRFALSLRGVTKSIAILREEAAKCALLCANCHAEVEAGYSEI